MAQYSLTILHLFPDLLNLYGDKGNIASLKKRLIWRGLDAKVNLHTNRETPPDFENTDILFLGGGSDKEQALVLDILSNYRDSLLDYVEKGGVLLAFCGGFPMLGTTIETPDGTINGLGILDIHTTLTKKRMIGDVILSSSLCQSPICGFENHPGATWIGDYKPLGTVLTGNGNDGTQTHEGLLYKNVFASYLHGPLFPKNPELCDVILARALKHKYPDFSELSPLDNSLEESANHYIVQNFMPK
ncbi:MAG: glutamine amidotransferase [Clostridia bacterium]|nr:glutamine amidotransferase [Clostridia bacterium]